jgi:hypothetical protein
MKKHIVHLTLVLLLTFSVAGITLAATDYGLVLKGPHRGEITQGNKTYPFVITIDYLFDDSGALTGKIEWPTLGSVHDIEGTLKGTDLFFKEVGYIKKGKAKLNCVYQMKYSPNLHVFQGVWNELGTGKGGTAVIKLNR